MDRIIIQGGRPLSGKVGIQGSKNSALPMMAAALLHAGTTVLHNCPKILDVSFMVEILKCLGAQVGWEDHTLTIDASNLHAATIPAIYAAQMRSSITLLGSLLGRMGFCDLPFPGGCVIGRRPIDLHIQVLGAMEAQVSEREGVLRARWENPKGYDFTFAKPSVGATENAIMAAVLAKGDTYLYGCAREPEILWLCKLLKQMGAKIRGIGSENLKITGVSQLKDTEFTVPADRIVAGTYLMAAAATKGRIQLEDAPVEEMFSILSAYEKMGGQYRVTSGTLVADATGISRPISYIETAVYPGFPTDLQSAFLAVLSAVPGRSHICEKVFENRYRIVPQLSAMGAHITVDGRDALIDGVPQLRGSQVAARELRGGAALVIAGLGAIDTTQVANSHYIERGYEDICRDIAALGGQIYKDREE